MALGTPGELRGRELGGTLYELECSALGAAVAALRQASGVIEAAIFGDKLHVLMRANPAELPDFLARQGVVAGAPRPIAPNLEDVFVQLVARPREAEALT